MTRQAQPDWIDLEDEGDEPEWYDRQRRLQHQVEIQSRQIEQVLSRHQVPAGVSGGSVRPHWVSFDLASQLSGGWEKLRRLTGDLTGEIASALGVPEVRLERQNGVLRLAVKRSDPHPVDLLDLLDLVPEAVNLFLAVGLDHQGQPVMLNLRQPDLHNVLIAGITGAGKSSLMRSIAVSLALTCRQSLAQMAVIALGSAPSGITTRPNPLYPVNYLPHLLFPVATEVDEAVEALAYLEQEIAYRAENGISSPTLIVLVDDADMLLRRVGGAVAGQLAALLHAPAEAGVRVIVGAANPALPDLWQMLQHNVDLRLVGRMADERSAQAATGREKSYAQYLDGKGDFIAVSAAGIEPFHAAYIDDYDLHLTLSELHRASSPVLLAQTLDDKPDLPPSWPAEGSQGFTYDSGEGRANMEQDDRSGLNTIEIGIDPVEGHGDDFTGSAYSEDDYDNRPYGAPATGQHLSWLDDMDQPGAYGGLALPLIGARSAYDPWSGGGEDVGHDEAVGAPSSIASPSFDEPETVQEDESYGPDEEGDGYSAEEVGDRQSAGMSSEPDISVETPSGQEAGYEMLPFDDGSELEEPEEEAEAGLEAAVVVEDEPETDDELDAEEIDDPADDGEDEGEGQVAGGRGGRYLNKEQAQKVWSLEPIYTDIDDDLWDAADGAEDDWRKRLH